MLTKTFDIISADLKFHAPYTHRIVLLCLEKGISYKITAIDLQNKPQWFLDIAPLGEVPVMRFDNSVLSDSFEIAKYLDSLFAPHFIPLLSGNHADYNTFSNLMTEINAFGKAMVMFFRNQQFDIAGIRTLYRYLEKFEDLLQQNIYLLGREVNYNDLALLPHVLQIEALDATVFPFSILAKFPHLQSWFSHMKIRPSVISSSKGFTAGFIEHLQQRGFYDMLI